MPGNVASAHPSIRLLKARCLYGTLFLGMLGFCPACYAIDCRPLDPPAANDTDLTFQGKLNGKIDGLFAKFAGANADAEGVYHNIQKDTLKEYPNASQTSIWERFIYLKCQLLSESHENDEQKNQDFNNLVSMYQAGPPHHDSSTSTENGGNAGLSGVRNSAALTSASSCNAAADPSNVTMADTLTDGYLSNGGLISLQSCVAQGSSIVCHLAYTNKANRSLTLDYNPRSPPWNGVLRDDYKETHVQRAGYFLIGKTCRHDHSVTLDKEQSVWFNQEFTGPTDGITAVTITIDYYGRFGPTAATLRAPIEKAQ